jgi:hypothetical protein
MLLSILWGKSESTFFKVEQSRKSIGVRFDSLRAKTHRQLRASAFSCMEWVSRRIENRFIEAWIGDRRWNGRYIPAKPFFRLDDLQPYNIFIDRTSSTQWSREGVIKNIDTACKFWHYPENFYRINL